MADEPTEVDQQVEAIAEAVLEGKDAIEVPPDLIADDAPQSAAEDAPADAAPAPAAPAGQGPAAAVGPATSGAPAAAPVSSRAGSGTEVAPSRDLVDLVKEMSVAQRIKAAIKGNRDARAILVHDPNPVVQRMVLQNPRVTDEEVLAIARDRNTSPEVLRVIADRRDWSSHYAIRTALLANPRAPLREARNFAPHEREPAEKPRERTTATERPAPAARAGEPAGDGELSGDIVEAERQVNAIAEAVRQGTDAIDVPEDFTQEGAAGPAPQEVSEEAKSLYARIKTMSVPQKVKLAMKGNKDARSILIRDTNKLIQRMVMQNPRITEDEILALAKDRNTEKEVLRLVADSKDWLKSYAIRLALVENAKTPLGDALRLLPGLLERDLKNVARSKNVPSTIAAQARKMVSQREAAQRGALQH